MFLGFSCGSAGKESTCNTGDPLSIPGLGRSPGEGKGYPLQYSGLENSMNYIVHWFRKNQTQLNNFHFQYQLAIMLVQCLWIGSKAKSTNPGRSSQAGRFSSAQESVRFAFCSDFQLVRWGPATWRGASCSTQSRDWILTLFPKPPSQKHPGKHLTR